MVSEYVKLTFDIIINIGKINIPIYILTNEIEIRILQELKK